MTTPKEPEYMFPDLQGLPEEFRRLAAEAYKGGSKYAETSDFKRANWYSGAEHAFEQAAQMLEERLNG